MAFSTDVAERVRTLAGRLAVAFAADQELAERLNDAQGRLMRGNDELWWGIHPDGLAVVYDEQPAVVDAAFAENRSEVLGAQDPLREIQRVHWKIHRAFCDYQSAAEERRQLAADVGELTVELITGLAAAGWSEERARMVNVEKLAAGEIELR